MPKEGGVSVRQPMSLRLRSKDLQVNWNRRPLRGKWWTKSSVTLHPKVYLPVLILFLVSRRPSWLPRTTFSVISRAVKMMLYAYLALLAALSAENATHKYCDFSSCCSRRVKEFPVCHWHVVNDQAMKTDLTFHDNSYECRCNGSGNGSDWPARPQCTNTD